MLEINAGTAKGSLVPFESIERVESGNTSLKPKYSTQSLFFVPSGCNLNVFLLRSPSGYVAVNLAQVFHEDTQVFVDVFLLSDIKLFESSNLSIEDFFIKRSSSMKEDTPLPGVDVLPVRRSLLVCTSLHWIP